MRGLSTRYPIEYRAWVQMRFRCFNPMNQSYVNYGARGITICSRWNKFANFLEDVGPRPTPKHSLGRIDNDGNYEPKNVRWETPEQQAKNKRPRHVLDESLHQMVLRAGVVNYQTAFARVRAGYSRKVAASAPAGRLRLRLPVAKPRDLKPQNTQKAVTA